jgi:hypothetical protein
LTVSKIPLKVVEVLDMTDMIDNTASVTDSLCTAVQKNCHIADARHASDFTLCVYLLKMREYYRWEMGYPFDASMPKENLGSWLSAREQLWESLEEEPFDRLNIDGQLVDPFATDEINRSLLPRGYVYSAGIGRGSAAHFFLGKLEQKTEYQGFSVVVAAQECARDLTAPPAMALHNTIFIRRESLQRMIWEKFQEWRWNKIENAMSRALSFYPFEKGLKQALAQMTESELQAAILHEIGELMAHEHLGDAWGEMLVSLPRSKAEIMARAVRDHLADALSTLPGLLQKNRVASLHFYMANLTAMRKDLFPGFAEAYRIWNESGRTEPMSKLIETAQTHWLEVARRMLEIHRKHGEHCTPYLESLIEANRL